RWTNMGEHPATLSPPRVSFCHDFRQSSKHLADALALWDHRENIDLALDTEIDQHAAIIIPGEVDRVLDFIYPLDGDTAPIISLSQAREVRAGERCPAIAFVLEQP